MKFKIQLLLHWSHIESSVIYLMTLHVSGVPIIANCVLMLAFLAVI